MIPQEPFRKAFDDTHIRIKRRQEKSTAFGGRTEFKSLVFEGKVNAQKREKELRKLVEQGVEADVILYANTDTGAQIQDEVEFVGTEQMGEIVQTDLFTNKLVVKLVG